MNRDDFLAQPDIKAFVRWLIDNLSTLSIDLRLRRSRFVPKEKVVQVNGIEDVTGEYQWGGDWTEVSEHLKSLRTSLRVAVDANDSDLTFSASSKILDWGNVPSSKPFLEALRKQNALSSYLAERIPLLSPAGSQKLSDLNKSVFAKFNSGMTKIHALLCRDGSPIYDGRVGAAIALLYHLYRNSTACLHTEPANHHCFAWGPGRDDPQSDHVRQIRNPALLGLGYKGTPQLLSHQSPHLWAQRQLILGWIMRAVLQKTKWYGGPEADIAERCHAFEAGLFMLGYDLRSMVPKGWNIPDPKKKAYPRRRKP
ncbi:TPA: hypothetical protein ACP32N_005030 [Pseudomonas aeruginosa]